MRLRAFVPVAAIAAAVAAGCAGTDTLKPLPTATTTLRVPVDGGDTLTVRVHGTGPDTLLLLPGGVPVGAAYLERTMGPLERGRTIVTFDWRGRGAAVAAHDPLHVSAEQDVEDLEAIRASLGARAISLLGDHYGAAIAALYARRFPDHVRRLVLTGPLWLDEGQIGGLAGSVGDTGQLRRYYRRGAERPDSVYSTPFCREFWGFDLSPMTVVDTTVRDRLADVMCDGDERKRRITPDVMNRAYGSLIRMRYGDSLAALETPTLVVTGSLNGSLRYVAERWALELPNAWLLAVESWPQFPWVSRPTQVFANIDAFLAAGRAPDAIALPDTLQRPVTDTSRMAGGS